MAQSSRNTRKGLDGPVSPRSPYVANNGLRVIDRTSQSITLTWSVEEEVVDGEKLETPNNTDDNTDSVDTSSTDQSCECREENWFEVEMKRGEHSASWISIYKGYSESYEINGLSSDSVLVFRLKRHKEEVWGTEVVASTEPTPPSTEDLNRAVEMNSIYLVSRILGNAKPSHLRKILVAHDRNGMTPLMVACYHGNIAIAERLIRTGCSVNEVSNSTKRTPLIYACIMGKQNIAVLLDQFGVDWKIRDNCGCNSMEYAINGSYIGLAKLAYSRLGPKSVHERDSSGWTPLMRAVIVSGSLEMLQFLIKKGADVNGTDRCNSKSVLMAAILSRRAAVVKFLLGKGANPLQENHDGKNCYQIANGINYREIKEILNTHLSQVQSSSTTKQSVVVEPEGGQS